MRPLLIPRKLELRIPQSRSWTLALAQVVIKVGHQLRRGLIVDLPKSRNHALRAGTQEGTRQADDALGGKVSAQAGIAGTQNHEIGGEFEAVNVAEAEKPVLGLALPVHQRKDEPGAFRMLLIENAVGCEVDDVIACQIVTEDGLAAGEEVLGHERFFIEAAYRNCFLARSAKPGDMPRRRLHAAPGPARADRGRRR